MKQLGWVTALVGSLCLSSLIFTTDASAKDVSSQTALKSTVKSTMKNLNSSVTVHYTGSERLTNSIIDKAIHNALYADGQITSTLKNYTYTYSNQTIKMSFSYYTTKAKAKAANKTMDAKVKSIKKTYKTDFDRVKAVNDYIVYRARYGGSSTDRYSAYGAIQNKVAVCQGYASAAYYMLDQLGIDVRYVTGTAGKNGAKQNHAWNKVKVDGKWYNLDTTWNDPTPNRPNISSYRYFLVSDKVMKKDHTEDQTQSYPKATNTKYDFFKDTSSVTYDTKNKMIYYANDHDNQRLYRYAVKTNKHKRISTKRVQFLAYKGGKLYFSNFSNGGKLARMTTSAKNVKTLKAAYSTNVYVKSNYVYYTVGAKNYKLKIS